jgi:hypothetical protein
MVAKDGLRREPYSGCRCLVSAPIREKCGALRSAVSTGRMSVKGDDEALVRRAGAMRSRRIEERKETAGGGCAKAGDNIR